MMTAQGRTKPVLGHGAAGRAVLASLLLAGGVAAPGRSAEAEPPPAAETLRIGVSYASVGALNRNDASAALKAWAATVARERSLQVVLQVDIFEAEEDLRRGIAAGFVHAVSMTTEEFFRSAEQPSHIYLALKGDSYEERFVLVVPRGSGLGDLATLRGRRLVRHVSPGTSPALPWLETELADRGLGRAAEFFGEVSTQDTPSKTVLRVFFRQSDACLVTARAFDIACELNPQLRQRLEVLATSPALVPGLFFFSDTYSSAQRREFEEAIGELHNTVVGQQVLTVFQSSRMEKHPLAVLDVTRRLFARHAALTAPPPDAATEAERSATSSAP